MAAGVFIIEEIRAVGAVTVNDIAPSGGEKFVWVSDATPPVGLAGGARACPRGIWTIGGRTRSVRTDYPGATLPSEQVLGVEQKNQVFEGIWQDKYNFTSADGTPGYAISEMRRFEAMCQRGNKCRISFQGEAFEGLITEWDFPYRADFEISYKFTVSVHARVDDPNAAAASGIFSQVSVRRKRIGNVVLTPQDLFNGVDKLAQLLFEEHAVVPRRDLVASIADDADKALGDVAAARDRAAKTLDEPAKQVGRMQSIARRAATQLREIRSTALAFIDSMATVRSDTTLGAQSVKGVLDFEEWSRATRYHARLLVGQSDRAAREADKRAKAPALRTYKPRAGESLYAIAQRFYGTPTAWAFIAERNRLPTPTLTGDETLLLPERIGG